MTPAARNAQPRLIVQIHFLVPHTLAHPNGAARPGSIKTSYWGGILRSYISSQKLKYSWQHSPGFLDNLEDIIYTLRSKKITEQIIIEPMRTSELAQSDVIDAIEKTLPVILHGRNATDEKARQILVLSYPEVEAVQKIVVQICEEFPTDKDAATTALGKRLDVRQGGFGFKGIVDNPRMAGGIRTAMYGRLMTSDPAASVDGAISVSPLMSVNEAEITRDYYAATDDLIQNNDDQTGAGHLGSVELTSGLYYGCVIIDVPQLVSNIEGVHTDLWMDADPTLSSLLVQNLINVIFEENVTAKKGSTADATFAQLVMVEIGRVPPRNLVDAYAKPIRPYLEDAIPVLAKHVRRYEGMKPYNVVRKVAAMDDPQILNAEWVSVPELGEWAGNVVRGE